MLNNHVLASMIQYAPDGIIVVDDKGVIQFANTQMQTLFEYTPEEIIGKTVEHLIPEDLRAIHVHHRKQFMDAPKTRSMGASKTLVALKKSGDLIPVEISLSPLKREQGVLVIAAIRDVSEKIKKEKKLLDANAELEHFVYIASHDLQEPLHSLKQLLALLKENLKDLLDQENQQLIERILNAGARMSTLIRDLLNFSCIGKEKHFEKVDGNEVLEEIQSNLKALIDSTKTTIVIKTPLPEIKVAVTEFKLLFQNLIDNAIKFRKKEISPIVTIDVQKQKNCWCFSVTDNGIGIEGKFYDKLFVIFQRLHHRDTYPGNGIGLAHCKKIVELHGGTIWVESQYGEGTTIFFTIPFNIKEPTYD